MKKALFSYLMCAWHATFQWAASCRVDHPADGADIDTPPPADWCCAPQADGATAGQTCLNDPDGSA